MRSAILIEKDKGKIDIFIMSWVAVRKTTVIKGKHNCYVAPNRRATQSDKPTSDIQRPLVVNPSIDIGQMSDFVERINLFVLATSQLTKSRKNVLEILSDLARPNSIDSVLFHLLYHGDM